MFLDTLNEPQREAATLTEGPLLLLAGAGSGKTRVLTHRIAYLIDELGVNGWNILAVTFTNKAAGEMRERVDKIIGMGAEQIWVATFHSTCVRILRRYIDRIGYDTNFTIYDSDDQKTLIKEVIKKLELDPKQYKEKSVLGAISSAKDELMDPASFALHAGNDFYMQKIADCYREYQEALKRNNALDFDDLIVKCVELLKSSEEVLKYYQERFKYIMVDEYQDTNTAQFELIRLLAGKYRNLCVVGDDDQSIYKFRGANIRNILDFEKVYPDAAVIKLEQNYRSTGNILAAANAVIKNNRFRKAKELWTAQEPGDLVRYKQFETAYEEAEFIGDEIVRKVRRRENNFGDFAVLYRTNAQSRLLEERMIAEGIPYDVVGGVNFYSRKEIKDVLAYLKTIDNGRDDVAVRRIINVPKRSIGNTSVDKVRDYAEDHSLSFFEAACRCEEIKSLGKAAGKIHDFATMILAFRAKAEYLGIRKLIEEILDVTGYRAELEESDEEDAEDRLNNIDELISKAAAFEASEDEPTLSAFLEEVALVADIDNTDDSAERVLLMTLHSAKGLEFDSVYMAGMEDGVFPGYMSIIADDKQEMEEERRLAYVGITRAKKHLTLTAAKTRMQRGETMRNPVSRFLKEIPAELLDGTSTDLKKSRDVYPEARSSYEETYDGEAIDWETETEQFSGFGSTSITRGGKDSTAPYDYRPKAIYRRPQSKPTDPEKKPFISQGIGALNSLAGVSKGAPAAADNAPLYGVGDRVSHVKFGQGTVVALSKETRDYKVTVDFDEAGQKVMYASFAKLKKI